MYPCSVVPCTGFWLWFSIDGKNDEMVVFVKWIFGIQDQREQRPQRAFSESKKSANYI